jgi:two-component sensor histidine kinase
LRSALQRAASRLQAISGVYKNLALSSTDLNAVRLHDYLADMCERLREGLLSPAIMLTLEADQVTVSHEAAVRIGLIVNELVTNAAKHAFPDGIGSIMLRLERRESEIFLSISDDGKGFDREAANDGLGSKLIAMLIRQIKATHATESDRGTIHRLTIPLPNK